MTAPALSGNSQQSQRFADFGKAIYACGYRLRGRACPACSAGFRPGNLHRRAAESCRQKRLSSQRSKPPTNKVERYRRALLKPADVALALGLVDVLPVGLSFGCTHVYFPMLFASIRQEPIWHRHPFSTIKIQTGCTWSTPRT